MFVPDVTTRSFKFTPLQDRDHVAVGIAQRHVLRVYLDGIAGALGDVDREAIRVGRATHHGGERNDRYSADRLSGARS